MTAKKNKQTLPPQKQRRQPGIESKMHPHPDFFDSEYRGSQKLKNKVAIITGGDSGIGRSIACYFAREGAKIVVVYLNEKKDAEATKKFVNSLGQECLLIAGDIGNAEFCKKIINKTIKTFGKLDILINNAAEQHVQNDFLKIKNEQLLKTFRTNFFGMFFLTQAAIPYLKKGSSIINTTSITAYKGHKQLVDYASTKGAVVSFTRSLSQNLVKKGIRVNAVAPGPIWTPLIPSTFPKSKVKKFGADVPMERPGQPKEVASCFVFLASDEASYITGQVLHPNGGVIVNG